VTARPRDWDGDYWKFQRRAGCAEHGRAVTARALFRLRGASGPAHDLPGAFSGQAT
jgi:hypothetical protein